MKAFLLALGVLGIFLVALPDVTYAQGFVPCEDGTQCNACDLIKMANTIIKWLIGVLILVFALIMAVAGFKLVTSAGNTSALEDAKSMFMNAIIGFLLVLAAWLIIDTIMKGILPDGTVNGRLWYQSIDCSAFGQTEPTAAAGTYETVLLEKGIQPGDTGDSTIVGKASGSSGCSDGTGKSTSGCSKLTIPTKSGSGQYIAPDMVNRLSAMHSRAGVSGARSTEAIPRTRNHLSRCHYNGTCIDYSKAGGMNAAEVKRVIDAAAANGLRPVYEVSSQSQKNTLVAGGVPAGYIKVLGDHISSPHFSIYGY